MISRPGYNVNCTEEIYARSVVLWHNLSLLLGVRRCCSSEVNVE